MNKVIVITGPTGVGKTKLSIAIAKKFNGEIINADSTQIYKHLDVATAKVTKEEQDNVIHHLISIKEVTDNYSVCDYQKDCRILINDIFNRKHTPILVGGTGLYIKAALYNYEFLQETTFNSYEDLSNEELYQQVKQIDPKTAIHINNRQRLVRFLNSYNNSGIKEQHKDELLYDTIFIGLTTSRDILYEKINNRVDEMVKKGLLQEASDVYESKVRTKAIMTPIGYKELFPYFDHIKSLDECLDEIKKNSRRYAKRQYTWFNHQLTINWFNVDFANFNNTIEEVTKFISRNKNNE